MEISSELTNYLDLEKDVAQGIIEDALRTGGVMREAIIDSATKRVVKRFDNTQSSGRQKTRITIPERLTFVQENKLVEVFPELDITFARDCANDHGYMAASRRCELAVILDKVGTSQDGQVILSDIGANYSAHFAHGRNHIHSCCPVVDARDEARATSRLMDVEKIIRSNNNKLTSFQISFFNSLTQYMQSNGSFTSPYLCSNKINKCTVKTNYAMLLHSIYDISVFSLADGLRNKGVSVAYGSFIWHPDMLLKDEGDLEICDVHYAIDKERDIIKFSFKGDSSFVYEHSFSNYFTWINTTSFIDSSGEYRYFLEFLDNKCGVQMFKIMKSCFKGTSEFGHIKRQLWFSSDKRRKIVKYRRLRGVEGKILHWSDIFEYSRLASEPSSVYEDVTMIVDSDLVEQGEEYALRVHPDRFKPIDIYSFLQSRNRSINMGGKEIVIKPNHEKPDKVFMLANAIYLKVYCMKYSVGKMVQKSIKEIDYNRELFGKSIWKKFFSSPPKEDLMEEAHQSNNWLRKFLHIMMYQKRRIGLDHLKTIQDHAQFVEVTDYINKDCFDAVSILFHKLFTRQKIKVKLSEYVELIGPDLTEIVRKIIIKNFSKNLIEEEIVTSTEQELTLCAEMPLNMTSQTLMHASFRSSSPHPNYKTMSYNGEPFRLVKLPRDGFCLFHAFVRFFPHESRDSIICQLSDVASGDTEISAVEALSDFVTLYRTRSEKFLSKRLRFPFICLKYLSKIFSVKIIIHDEVYYNYFTVGSQHSQVIRLMRVDGHVDLLLPLYKIGPYRKTFDHSANCRYLDGDWERHLRASKAFEAIRIKTRSIKLREFSKEKLLKAGDFSTACNDVNEYRTGIKPGTFLAHREADVGYDPAVEVAREAAKVCNEALTMMQLDNSRPSPSAPLAIMWYQRPLVPFIASENCIEITEDFRITDLPKIQDFCSVFEDGFVFDDWALIALRSLPKIPCHDFLESEPDLPGPSVVREEHSSIPFEFVDDNNTVSEFSLSAEIEEEDKADEINEYYCPLSVNDASNFSDLERYSSFVKEYLADIMPECTVYEAYDEIHNKDLGNDLDIFYQSSKKNKAVNRCTYKLSELLDFYHLCSAGTKVLDLCGAPGGFFQEMTNRGAHVLTVSAGDSDIKYAKQFESLPNVKYVNILRENTDFGIFDLVTADGADNDSYRKCHIFSAEARIAVRSLVIGGSLIIKVSSYYTCDNEAISILKKNFSDIYIHKPIASKFTNSEVYLVCKGFGGHTDTLISMTTHRQILGPLLSKFHKAGVEFSRMPPGWFSRILRESSWDVEFMSDKRFCDTREEDLMKIFSKIVEYLNIPKKKSSYDSFRHTITSSSVTCVFMDEEECLDHLTGQLIIVVTRKLIRYRVGMYALTSRHVISDSVMNLGLYVDVLEYDKPKEIYHIDPIQQYISTFTVFMIQPELMDTDTDSVRMEKLERVNVQGIDPDVLKAIDRVGSGKFTSVFVLSDCVEVTLNNFDDLCRSIGSLDYGVIKLAFDNGRIKLQILSENLGFNGDEMHIRFRNLIKKLGTMLEYKSSGDLYYSYELNALTDVTPESLGLRNYLFVYNSNIPVDCVIEVVAAENFYLTTSSEGVKVGLSVDQMNYAADNLNQAISNKRTILVKYNGSAFNHSQILSVFSPCSRIIYLYVDSFKNLVSVDNKTVALERVAQNSNELNIKSMIEVSKYWEFENSAVINNLKNTYNRFKLSAGSTILKLVDSSEGIYSLIDSKWIIRPAEILKNYSAAFDGEKLVDLTKEGKRYSARTKSPYVVVSKDTVFLSGHSLYSATSYIIDEINSGKFPGLKCDFVLRSGAPGSGKTTDILRNHIVASSDNLGDIVLTSTRESAVDLRNRSSLMYPEVDPSLFERKYRTIDSYLMHGRDMCENLYIDEVYMDHPGKTLMCAYKSGCSRVYAYGDSAQIPFINRLKQLKLSFNDFSLYSWNVESRSHSYRCPRDVVAVVNDMKLYPFVITGSNNVRESMNTKLITTVSEIQVSKGDQVLTYTQAEKDDLKREDPVKYSNVLTVHEFQGNQNSTVVLVRRQTKAVSVFDSKNHVLVALTRHTLSLTYYTTQKDLTYKLIELSKSLNKEAFYVSASSAAGGDSGWCTVDKEYFYESADTVFEITASNLTRSITFANIGHSWIPAKFTLLSEHQDMYMDRNNVPLLAPLHYSYLQSVYDDIFPGHSTRDRRLEPVMVGMDDFTIATCEFKMKFHAIDYYRYEPDWFMTPAIRTAIQPRVEITPQQVLYAYSERNGGAPDYMEIADVNKLVDDVYSAFERTFIGDRDVYNQFEQDKITINAYEMENWLKSQKTEVRKSLENNSHYLMDYNPSQYYFNLKRNAKPVLDGTGASRIVAPQTIAYLDKLINAILCPIARRIKERLLRVLNKNFVINTDMSNVEFENLISKRFPPSFVSKFPFKLENDAGKYDKSQLLRLMLIIRKFLMKFGMEEWLLDWWLAGLIQCTLINFQTGFKGSVFYQRKSGEPITFLANTVLMMAVSCYLYNLEGAVGMIAGDDSYFWLKYSSNNTGVYEEFAALFNLEVKPITKITPYFCSKFIMPLSENEWRVLPDLAKVLTKLGRLDLVNREHVEQYRISTLDNLSSYWDTRSGILISYAMFDRYNVVVDGDSVISTLYYYLSSIENFSQLFYYPENYVARHHSVLPDIDI